MNRPKIAVITGASSGMGREFALQIAENYRTIDEIWIIARRLDKLQTLKREISNKKVRMLNIDLTTEEGLFGYKSMLERINPSIRVLVNSAGYGIIGKVSEISLQDSLGMINLNCESLVAMIGISLDYMHFPSNIINLASSAGFMPQPSFAVYAATKSFVISYSRALNQELMNEGVTVTAVCPGPVNTEFFDVAEKINKSKKYKKLFRSNPEKVVKKALLDSYYFKDVSVYGTSMNAFRLIAKLVPHKNIIKYMH